MWGSLKTTLAGIGVAFLNLYANGATLKNAALSIGLALLGSLAKDFNSTGGTNPTTSEAIRRVEK